MRKCSCSQRPQRSQVFNSMDLESDSSLLHLDQNQASPTFTDHLDFESHRDKDDSSSNPFTWYNCSKSKAPKHISTHGPDNLKCEVCHRACSSVSNLNAHMQQHKNKFQCHICHKKLCDRWRLKRHLLLHEETVPHSCELCGKVFQTKQYLQSHMKNLHSHSRPHQCEVCGKTFKLNSLLEHHKETHNVDRPYICCHCGQTFKLKKNFRAHEQAHRSRGTHKCEVCQKTFARKRNLNAHCCFIPHSD